jgi:hypothetical protein
MTKLVTTSLMIVGAGAIAGVVLAAQQPASRPATPTRPAPAAPRPMNSGQHFATIGTIKEIMQTIVDPSADVLFDSVSYNITTAGIEEVQPRTTEDWMNVRRNALLLAEATNLLQVPGRKVAPDKPIPGLENEPPGPEDLTPAEIQPMIDGDRAAFNKLAQGLAEAAQLALKAADARSVEKLFESGDDIDRACENCHLKYWYPKGKTPAPGATTQRKR